MASKFVLDTGQLDTDYLSTPATLILDSASRGKLDTNVLSSGLPIVGVTIATFIYTKAPIQIVPNF